MLTEEADASRTVQLLGSVVANPNSFGRVQAGHTGHFHAPDGGLPYVGKAVNKGDLLGYFHPHIDTINRGTLDSEVAELEARIAAAQTKVTRYTERPGVIPPVKVDEARGELEALRRRRAELAPVGASRIELRAPVSGIVTGANVVTGQSIEARELLFEIVDPSQLWVEANAIDGSIADAIAGATAVTRDGKSLPLQFIGRGLTLRQQTAPLTFRLMQAVPELGIGTSVTVMVQTTASLKGILLPSSSVIRGPSGLPTVWIKAEPERFEPVGIKVQPLDGQRILVTAGLKPGMRVVTEGVTLINQIR